MLGGTTMAEQRNNKWNWEVSGFEPRTWSSSSSTSLDNADYKPGAPLVRRYSISAASALAQSELSNNSVASKLQKPMISWFGAQMRKWLVSALGSLMLAKKRG